MTGLAGFEPAAYSLGGCRPIQSRLQAHERSVRVIRSWS